MLVAQIALASLLRETLVSRTRHASETSPKQSRILLGLIVFASYCDVGGESVLRVLYYNSGPVRG